MWGTKLNFGVIENNLGNSGTIPIFSQEYDQEHAEYNQEHAEYNQEHAEYNQEHAEYNQEHAEYNQEPEYHEYNEKIILIPERSLFNIRLKMKKCKIDYATMKCLKIK
jgi:TATA-binding protein-associated factor Taf7